MYKKKVPHISGPVKQRQCVLIRSRNVENPRNSLSHSHSASRRNSKLKYLKYRLELVYSFCEWCADWSRAPYVAHQAKQLPLLLTGY